MCQDPVPSLVRGFFCASIDVIYTDIFVIVILMNITNTHNFLHKLRGMMRGNTSDAKTRNMNFTELLRELAHTHGLRAILSLLLSFLAVNLMPVATFLAAAIVLVIADWITGISASLKTKENITSRKLGRTIVKICFYSLTIILVMMVEKTFFKGDYLVYLVSAYIALKELYSNLENIGKILDIDILTIVKSAIKTPFKNIK